MHTFRILALLGGALAGELVQWKLEDDPLICDPEITVDYEQEFDDAACIPRTGEIYHVGVYVVGNSVDGCYYQNETFIKPILDSAVSSVWNNFAIDLNYTIIYDDCQSAIALNTAVITQYDNTSDCYDIFIGLTCDVAFEATAQIVKSWSIPLIAPFARNVAFAVKDQYYSDSIRTGLTGGNSALFMSKLFNYHNDILRNQDESLWEAVSFISPENTKHGMQRDFGIPGDCATLLGPVKNYQSMTNLSYYFMGQTDDYVEKEIKTLIQTLHNLSRVQVWCVPPALFTNAMVAFEFLYPKEFPNQWAIFYFDPYISYQDSSQMISAIPAAVRSSIKVLTLSNVASTYRTSLTNKCELEDEYQNNVVAGGYFDAFYMYGKTLSELEDCRNNTELLSAMKSTTIVSNDVDGRTIVMNSDGDQVVDFTVYTIANNVWAPCLRTLSNETNLEISYVPPFNDHNLWENGVPVGIPKCGLDGSECVGDTNLSIVSFSLVIAGVFLFSAIVLVIAFVCYRNRQRKSAEDKLLWLIPEGQIKLKTDINQSVRHTAITLNTGSMYSGSAIPSFPRMSKMSISSRNFSISSYSSDLSSDFPVPKSETILSGFYSDMFVALKPLPAQIANIAKPTNAKIISDMRQLISLQHNHIAKFFGIYTININGECVTSLVTEFGSKGSLKDLLEDKDTSKFNLTWEMKRCLMLDVIQGLHAIHKQTPIGFHGNLKSENCIVDGRLTVKLTDFGIPSILDGVREYRDMQNMREIPLYQTTDDYYRSILWMPPEKIRPLCQDLFKTMSKTTYDSIQIENRDKFKREQSADMYSFGVICQQIMYRKGVYWLGPNAEKTDAALPTNIVRKMFDKSSTITDWQPFVDDIDVHRYSLDDGEDLHIAPDIRSMVQECWTMNPDERLKVAASQELIKTLMSHMQSSSLVDSLMDRMEDYSCHLEDLVEERTIQYKKEKERADGLLYRMLPKCVADDMKAGRQLKPKAFDNVTVFFSDIVNFSEITKRLQSKPKEIVRMLDNLYTLFDSITEKFSSIYKVETIGADYMVVSGLPEPLDDPPDGYYASEIAKFSLKLMERVKYELSKADIHEDDSMWLSNLRIGFHSGGVVAGVVGQKMPRYCLFGDTVNTASRMKSNGAEQRIHVSREAFAELQKAGGFNIDHRGKVYLKGRGDMDCYWLKSIKQTAKPRETISIKKVTSAHGGVKNKIQGRHTVDNFEYQHRWSGISGNSYGQIRTSGISNSSKNSRNFINQRLSEEFEPRRRKTTTSVMFKIDDNQFHEYGESRSSAGDFISPAYSESGSFLGQDTSEKSYGFAEPPRPASARSSSPKKRDDSGFYSSEQSGGGSRLNTGTDNVERKSHNFLQEKPSSSPKFIHQQPSKNSNKLKFEYGGVKNSKSHRKTVSRPTIRIKNHAEEFIKEYAKDLEFDQEPDEIHPEIRMTNF